MRISNPTDPGFIAFCVQLAQSTFSDVMPSNSAAEAPSNLSRTDAGRAVERPGWMSMVNNWFHRQQMKEREAYLAKSTDIFELERRIRHLERRPGF
jgi:hypothetical protein